MEQVIDNWRARLARCHMADRSVGDAFIWNHETRATGSHAGVRKCSFRLWNGCRQAHLPR